MHFEHFEKLGIPKLLTFKRNFFQIEHFTLQFFRMKMRGDAIKEGKKKSRKKVLNPNYSLGLLHDVCIMIF